MQIQFHKNGKRAVNLQIITTHRLKMKENILIRSCVIYSLFLLKGIDNIMIVSKDKKSTRSWPYNYGNRYKSIGMSRDTVSTRSTGTSKNYL